MPFGAGAGAAAGRRLRRATDRPCGHRADQRKTHHAAAPARTPDLCGISVLPATSCRGRVVIVRGRPVRPAPFACKDDGLGGNFTDVQAERLLWVSAACARWTTARRLPPNAAGFVIATGRKSWILAVKCTFDIAADGSTVVSEDQPPVLRVPVYSWRAGPQQPAVRGRSRPHQENHRASSSSATPYAPRGRPVAQMDVGFRGRSRPEGRRCSATAPGARSAPRRRSRSSRCRSSTSVRFGGVDLKSDHPERDWEWRATRVGTGFAMSCATNLRGVPAPNFEYPHERIESWKDRPRPAGFEPIGPHWQPRVAIRRHLRRCVEARDGSRCCRRTSTIGSSSARRGSAGAVVPARRRARRVVSPDAGAASCASPCRKSSSASRPASPTAAARFTRSGGCTPSSSTATRRVCRSVWHTRAAVSFQDLQARTDARHAQDGMARRRVDSGGRSNVSLPDERRRPRLRRRGRGRHAGRPGCVVERGRGACRHQRLCSASA